MTNNIRAKMHNWYMQALFYHNLWIPYVGTTLLLGNSTTYTNYLLKAIIFYVRYTPSIPNYVSVLIGTQILRNFWGIYKNAQLGSNSSLNQLSNELFCIQNGVVNKKIWWFDQVVVWVSRPVFKFVHQDVL
jgi:hypothetical protein